ncbi:MAG: hypothetical protein IT260_24370 [Saprospiraceae bacterium]|nr:hypothetical protein [Saprospiraceae bacterium]
MRSISERQLFFILLALALVPVWSGRFFVTGDGPCHVYNARVLLDYWQGNNWDFYAPFYNVNTNFEPNLIGHLCLALLQLLLAPEMAEKVFLSGYVLLFGLGFRYLVRQVQPDNLFLSSVGVLFIWHHLLQSGFYNYACSIALFFWVSGFWLKYRQDWTNRRLLQLAGLWLLLYSAHPMGLVFSGAFIGSAMLFLAARDVQAEGLRPGLRVWLLEIKNTTLAALPMLVLFAEYLFRRPNTPESNQETVDTAGQNLLELSALVTMNSTERDTVKGIALFVLLLALGAAWSRLRQRKWATGDFLLLFLGLALWQYFQQTGSKAMELLLPMRIQIFPWLALVLWTSTGRFPAWARQAIPGISLAFLCVLLYLRVPIHRAAAAQVEDYLSCLPHLEDRSVLLVLNYEYSGSDAERKPIGNRIWLFNHAADYIGAYRTAILSDNYEALRTYFPLGWNWQRDMYVLTDKDGINFDNRPPRADILGYTLRSGGRPIDYVLVLNYDDRHFDHPYAREIRGQLDGRFTFVYGSPGQRAELWRRK